MVNRWLSSANCTDWLHQFYNVHGHATAWDKEFSSLPTHIDHHSINAQPSLTTKPIPTRVPTANLHNMNYTIYIMT